jgi:hypothetical protein
MIAGGTAEDMPKEHQKEQKDVAWPEAEANLGIDDIDGLFCASFARTQKSRFR